MRLISQDGIYDMPYELCAIYLNKEPMGEITVRCRWQADQKSSNVLATYRTMEIAKLVLQDMHDMFMFQSVEYSPGVYTYNAMFQFPPNKDMEDKMEKTNRLSKEELAKMLNGRECGSENNDCRELAKENGLVFVIGESDDLMELDGAIYDEGSCFDGGDVYLDKDGIAQDGEHLANKITAVWCGKVDDEPVEDQDRFTTKDGRVFAWGYITDIPHTTFDIYEDGDPYCRGIVFSIEDLK